MKNPAKIVRFIARDDLPTSWIPQIVKLVSGEEIEVELPIEESDGFKTYEIKPKEKGVNRVDP